MKIFHLLYGTHRPITYCDVSQTPTINMSVIHTLAGTLFTEFLFTRFAALLLTLLPQKSSSSIMLVALENNSLELSPDPLPVSIADRKLSSMGPVIWLANGKVMLIDPKRRAPSMKV